jgi:integrase/recombinase XerC
MARRKPDPPSAPLYSLLPDWVREMKANHQSPATITAYSQRLRYFCAWLAPDGNPEHCTTRVNEVNKAMVQDYFSFLHATVSHNTVMSRHIALSAYFRFCLAFDERPDGINPIKAYVKSLNPEAAPTHVLSPGEVKALLATCERGKRPCDKRDYAILRVFMATGLRLAELHALDLADVQLDGGLIIVRHGKGGLPREVGIGARTVRALGQWIHVRARHKDAHLAPLWLGKQSVLTYEGIRSVVYTRAKQAGLSIHPHQFRHLFAHGFLAKGGQETALLTLGGWKNAKMIHERYGKSLAAERAIQEHHRLGIGEDW